MRHIILRVFILQTSYLQSSKDSKYAIDWSKIRLIVEKFLIDRQLKQSGKSKIKEFVRHMKNGHVQNVHPNIAK